jgi:hypothetical protein
MTRSSLRPVACTLAVAVLLMLGATTGLAFAHEVQHAAHHTAGMHATGVCAWMCATAGAVTTAALQPLTCALVQAESAQPASVLRSSDSSDRLHARAPPVLL